MVQKRDCDYAIHMVHGMLLDRASFPGPFYTLVEQIWETEADFTLAGHNHLVVSGCGAGRQALSQPRCLAPALQPPPGRRGARSR